MFLKAVGAGDSESVQKMLSVNPGLVKARLISPWDNDSPLQIAAASGNDQMVELLLHAGADVNATNYSGISALDEAAFHGHDDVAETLLKAGANVHQVGYRDLATPLMVAAVHGNAGVVRLLLKFGASADATDRTGQKAFEIAQKLGLSNVCDVLTHK